MSRVSREQAALNRQAVIAAASALFRRRGLDGAGIDEVMAVSGLTRGAFYGQFGSKEELAGEACDHAFQAAAEAWGRAEGSEQAGRMVRIVDYYLAPQVAGQECPLATLAGDAARAPTGGAVRRAFTSGLERLVAIFRGRAQDDRALAVMAAMVGANILRRASENATLSDAVDEAVRKWASEVSPRRR
jgi:TetR/AcrR family transcriptional regulator, transcriptional repressor for nem operon